MRKIIFVIFFGLAFSPLYIFSQGLVSQENTFETNWNFAVNFGAGSFLSEYASKQGYFYNDMNHLLDWTASVHIAKMVWNQCDVGMEFGIANYKGFNQNPSNINWLMLSPTFNNNHSSFQPHAIYYRANTTWYSAFIKYNFINFKTFSRGYTPLNIYIKLASGCILPAVEMGFIDKVNYEFTNLEHPLFSKGKFPSPQKDMHFLISPAMGFNYQLNDRIFLSFEPKLQIMFVDYLDGIYAYTAEISEKGDRRLNESNKINTLSFATFFSSGITYFFNFDTHKQIRQIELPWYENLYRSYYSKYHKPSSKKQRQQRMPFYNDKFED